MDSAPCHERLLKPRSTPLAATTHYVPADRDRGRRDGSHFPAKLVSQLRGTAFPRNILVSLDDQHTRTHTLRVTLLPRNYTPSPWSNRPLEYWNFQLGLRTFPHSVAVGLRSLFLQLLDRHSPPRRGPTKPIIPFSAALHSCFAQDADPRRRSIASVFTAPSPRARALHQ